MAFDQGVVSQPYEGQLAELADLKAVLNVTHKIGLIQSGFAAPSNDSVYADFDAAKATFGGYAAQAVVITADPGVDAGGVPMLKIDPVDFVSDDGDPANSVIGWYLWDDAAVPKKVKDYALFNNPVAVNKAAQQLQLEVVLRGGGDSTWNLDF